MTNVMRTGRAVLAAGVLAVTAGCAGAGGLGTLGDILGAATGGGGGQQQGQGQLLVEIQGVDANRQIIGVRTEDGRTGNLYFDGNTTVVYNQRQYPVTALERGDIADVLVQQTSQGQLYASQIQVRQSVQERTGQASGTQGNTGGGVGSAVFREMTGTVGQVDVQRGWFELRTSQGTFAVALPTNPPSDLSSRFNTLRAGQTVRIEGVILSNNRVELARFL